MTTRENSQHSASNNNAQHAPAAAHQGVLVWIDHREARIFHVELAAFQVEVLSRPTHHVHRHAKGASESSEHPEEQRKFFHSIAGALKEIEPILIVGPSTAKLQLMRYLHANEPKLEARVQGVETVDHPTDAQLVAYAKSYFGVPPPRGPASHA